MQRRDFVHHLVERDIKSRLLNNTTANCGLSAFPKRTCSRVFLTKRVYSIVPSLDERLV